METKFKFFLSFTLSLTLAFIGLSANASVSEATETSDDTFFVVYHDKEGRIIFRDEYVTDYTFNNDYPAFFTGVKYSNTGWNERIDGSGTTYNTGDKLASPLTADLNVYSVLTEGHYVRFDSDGGTPIEQQFVMNGQTVSSPSNPTKSGYSFSSWKIKGTETDYNFSTPVTSDLNLVATWTAATANYTVQIWLEKAEHSGTTTANDYTCYGSFLKSGTTGGEVAITTEDLNNSTIQAAIMSHTTPHDFQLYKMDNACGSNAATLTESARQQITANGGIAGDGSTVFNVYFRRLVCNFTLDDGNVFGTGRFSATYQMRNGESVAAWISRHGISVPSNFNSILSQSTLTQNYNYIDELKNLGGTTLYSGTCDARGLSICADFVNAYRKLPDVYKTALVDNINFSCQLQSSLKGNVQFCIVYKIETLASALAGNEKDFTKYNESNFTTANTLLYNRPDGTTWDGFIFGNQAGLSGYFFQSKSDAGNYGKFLIGGSEVSGEPRQWTSGSTIGQFQPTPQKLQYYLLRNSYFLSFITKFSGVSISPISIYYGDSIKKFYNQASYTDAKGAHQLIPNSTTYTDDGGVIWLFNGWYDNELLTGSPIDIETTSMTMPGGSLTLYAKWTKNNITIEYDANGGTVEGQSKIERVHQSGAVPTRPADPVPPAGAEFLGWSINGILYDFTTPIYEDTGIKALYYISNNNLTVSYSPGLGTGVSPTDANIYIYGANCAVLAPTSEMKAPTDKYFDFWQDGNENKYYPGDELYMTDNVTLTAQYSDCSAIVIRRKNLVENESAIYSVYWKTSAEAGDNTYVKEFTVSINNVSDKVEGKDYSEKTIVLSKEGVYKVVEDIWSWAYDSTAVPTVDPSSGSQSGPCWATKTINNGNTVTFTFVGESNEYAPAHDEEVKENVIIIQHPSVSIGQINNENTTW